MQELLAGIPIAPGKLLGAVYLEGGKDGGRQRERERERERD
jgi:hypothetical protein